MIRIHRVHWRAGGSGLKSLGKYLGKQGQARLSYRLIIIYSYAHIFAFLRLRNAFCAFKIHFTVGRKNLKLLAHKGGGQSGKYLEVEKYLAREEDVGGEEKRKDFSADGRKESWELKTLVEDIHNKKHLIASAQWTMHIHTREALRQLFKICF